MKPFRSILLPIVFLFSLASAAHGTPLLPDTLDAYIALGSGGGEVDGALFSDFTLLEIPAGAIPIDPSAVMVIPVNNALGPGLEFVVNQIAGAGEFLDIRIGYLVSGTTFSGATLSMTDSSATGDGAVTAIEDLWPGGVYDPFNPGDLSLITFSIEGFDDTFEHVDFAPVANLGVIVDIGVDGGRVEVDPEGAGALFSVTNQFTTASQSIIPEPATLVLLSAGLGCLGACRRRRASTPDAGKTQHQPPTRRRGIEYE